MQWPMPSMAHALRTFATFDVCMLRLLHHVWDFEPTQLQHSNSLALPPHVPAHRRAIKQNDVLHLSCLGLQSAPTMPATKNALLGPKTIMARCLNETFGRGVSKTKFRA